MDLSNSYYENFLWVDRPCLKCGVGFSNFGQAILATQVGVDRISDCRYQLPAIGSQNKKNGFDVGSVR
jgi:hypothetical protein